MNTLHIWIRRTLTAATLGTMALASQATLVSSGSNNPLVFSWSQNTVDGLLQGNGSMQIAGFGTATLQIDVTLNNTSALATQRLVSFGFGIDPNATQVTFEDAADGGIVGAEMAGLPGGLKKVIEVCGYSGPNCSGGGGDGIFGLPGNPNSDSFVLKLTRVGNWGTEVDIAPIGFKYQTQGTSYEFTTSSSGTSSAAGGTSGDIPEPGSSALVLMGLGLVAAGFRFRRRTPTAAA